MSTKIFDLSRVREDLSDSEKAWSYIVTIRGLKKSKDLEPVLASKAESAFNYARYVLKGRFILGEKAIAKSGRYSLLYAKDVISGRFALGEEKLCVDYSKIFMKDYLRYHLKIRVPYIEERILWDAELCYLYSVFVMRGRFPEAEPKIISSPEFKKPYLKWLQEIRNMPKPEIQNLVNYNRHRSNSDWYYSVDDPYSDSWK